MIQQLPVTAYYSGTSGTYCSIVPGMAATAWLQRVCARAEWYGFTVNSPLDRHITVIHSPNAIPYNIQQQVWANPDMIGSDTIWRMDALEFIHWPGNNDMGYVVLSTANQQLMALNSWLRSNFGLDGDFPDFAPHITIATDAYSNTVERAQMLCDELQREFLPQGSGVELIFTGLRMEDLK
jgi:2'-5' RNA ligase